MKMRTPPFAIVPVHRFCGYTAPAMMISADSYEQALKIAKNTNHLFKKYPNVWALV
jgi:hypothetical protein